MKSLTQSIKESIQSKINEARINPKDEKLFWKWIDAIDGKEMISVINKEESGEPLYKKAAELGTTEEQFNTFSEIFYSLASDILDVIENDDPDMSDDGCQYASWSAPFYGEKEFKKALKSKDWYKICDEYEGEQVGYAMTDYEYSDYLADKGLEPEGFK
jgi:hypothetical protein